MTDNERKFDAEYQEYVQMAKRVGVPAYDYQTYLEHCTEVSDKACKDLREQLEQKDKTIAELRVTQQPLYSNRILEKQNTIMLSALAQIRDLPMHHTSSHALRISTEGIAKVKEITVSEKEVSETTAIPSEPTI